jgi:hypothetical protein
MVAGYPFSTAQIVVDQAKGTSSLVYKAFNPLIMGVDVMHEVNNVHAEPGMSGGILFANNSPDSTGPLILGMISHRRKAGDGNITAYAIPAQIVVGFMREVIEDPSRRSRIRQEVRNQLRGPFDVSIGTYNFEYLDEGNVQAFRLRKIGHFPDSPQPPQEKYFEPMLDYYLPQHPLCVPYLVASWGTRYLGNFNFDFRLKPVTNPIEILDNQDRDEEEPLFLMRCPQTAQSLTKLASVRDQLEQFFSVVPVDLNRITRRLKEFHDELMQNLSDSQDQQIPRYVISFKAHEARDFLKGYAASRAQIAQQGQGPRLEQILNDAAQALEFINL